VHCSVENAAVSCVNQRERLTQYWASPSEEEEEAKERKKNISPVLRVPGLGMKALEDERYVVIKAYKLTVFEIWRDFNVLQGVVTYASPVEAFATAIKNLDRWKSSLVAWSLRSEALDRLILREFKG